ncbi:hypothetical protein VI08_18955 [Luteibacter yeojuensis]|uniref:LuxR family transcriptional regulator n=2 Tax=Luteibacter yeojuensis TaxID=345309 RepID=A0A0F3K508_9GAMM|nr:hypothetical protein VI08_18955 [Luteibacter yeojuensis]
MLAATLAASGAHAAPAASAPSPLFGRWAVDTSRMDMPPEARPKSVTLAFSDAGGGKVGLTVDIVFADGKTVHTVGTNPADGTSVPVVGSPEADAAAMEHPQANVLVMGLSMGGVPASTRVYAVAPDGKTMTEVVSFYTNEGKPAMRTHYFTRVASP